MMSTTGIEKHDDMAHVPRVAQAKDTSAQFVLSDEDVERLLTEETPDARIDVLKKVAEDHGQQKYSLRELALAEQIFRVMLKDTETSVRETLAHSLKDNPRVPRDIILSLTQDVDRVSLPILEYSPVLSDADIIAILKAAKQQDAKPLAVAKRKHISEVVAVALVQTQNVQAVTQLMGNPGAKIPEKAYKDALRDHGKQGSVATAIAHRPDLPITVVENVISLVSDSLANVLRTQYHIAPAMVTAETEKTREIATLRLIDGHQTNPRDVEKLVDQLQAFGRLTPSIILTSLCRGNLYFFEISLARLSHIPVRNAQLLIHDKGGLGFKALYAKAGLPEKFLVPSRMLLEIVAENQRTGQPQSANTLAQKLIHKAGGQNIENISYLLALIRQSA
jgi:uncharacterized protein (DUF2336 family)